MTALPDRDPPLVAACVKWVDLHPDIDPVSGHVVPSGRGWGFSPADEAALEVALRLADAWSSTATLVCAGPAEAEVALEGLGASGAARVVRIDHSGDQDSALTADVLASVVGPTDLGAEVVVCGDLSYDRGSGSVPALLAHHLQAAQALGLVEVDALPHGRVRAVRRLDGARREVLEASAPVVLSVEGAVAGLRRAGLAATLGTAVTPGVEHRQRRLEGHVEPPRYRPLRPRARVLAPPRGDSAFERVVQLTGALVERTPPRTVELAPAEAARLIVDQLAAWGYLPEVASDGTAPEDRS